MKTLLLFIPLLFHSIKNEVPLQVIVNWTSTSKFPAETTIYYDKNKPLRWDDFKGEPNIDSRSVAVTTSGFGYVASMVRNSEKQEIKIDVYCHFDKSKSWVKKEAKRDDILRHEQLHFDLSYLAASRFKKRLEQYHFTNVNYKTILPQMYREELDWLNETQKDYDFETRHGLDEEAQALWEEKVKKELASL